ncbi:uncharacterized protein KY384_001097 [Bacidia gigantensis]|uniref:uncharacterized protein n=1 Tax=Bacidia gigantensis TaxID=2732470 RepID=UPI001D05770E|nr:uncharacterized protein KY384_001097 [Bacidia gigantensis]KAG8534253.1 hypothetical protein KY384_001097 [Bacidia gigantensis]
MQSLKLRFGHAGDQVDNTVDSAYIYSSPDDRSDIEAVLIPVTAFALGTWQIFRLRWKTDMITKYEDRILKPPLPLPPRIDPSAISEFNYRRVYATGILRYDQEMLIGPRIHDGRNGFYVVTPLERGDGASKVLVNRGWIPKKFENQRHRKVGLPTGRVTVQGLLREPWKKNLFTPDNKPEDGAFYFPDVHQMADFSGSDRVWIEETMEQDLIKAMDREAVGIPIGRAAAVNLRNNHTQYIFTWYALSAATSVMFWMLVKKPPPDIARRVRQSKEWS